MFRVARTGNLSQPVTVRFSMSGTATLGTDYILTYVNGNNQTVVIDAANEQQVILPANQSSIFVVLTPRFRTTNQASKRALMTLATPANYVNSFKGSASVILEEVNLSTISFSTLGSTVLAPGSISNGFRITRTGGLQGRSLTVRYTVGGTASNGSNYGFLSGEATIPAGQSSVVVPISIPERSGTTAIPQKTVTITPQATSGSYILANQTGLNYTIPAYQPGEVGVYPASSTMLLTGTNDGFIVTRTGDNSQSVTIPFAVGGTAIAGTDYTSFSNAVTIPAGQNSVTVPITVLQRTGNQSIPERSLTVTLNPPQGFTASTGAEGVSFTIPAYEPAVVSLDPGASTTLQVGTVNPGFTIQRTSGNIDSPLTVQYTFAGTAEADVDYQELTGTATIPAGAESVTVPIRTYGPTGTTAKPERSIAIALASGNGYTLGTGTTSATYTIPAYNPVEVSIEQTGSVSLQPGEASGFTISRTGPITSPLTVTYTVSGSAIPGTDYQTLTERVLIPAGQTSAQVAIQALTVNSRPERTLTVTLDGAINYATPGDISIEFTLPAAAVREVITLTATEVVNGILITRPTGADATNPITLAYTTGGTAVAGTDYSALPGTITIGAGETEVLIPVDVLSTATDGSTVVLTFTPPDGYEVGGDTTMTISNIDDGTDDGDDDGTDDGTDDGDDDGADDGDDDGADDGDDDGTDDDSTDDDSTDDGSTDDSTDDDGSGGDGIGNALIPLAGLGGLGALVGTGSVGTTGVNGTLPGASCSVMADLEELKRLIYPAQEVRLASIDWAQVEFSNLPGGDDYNLGQFDEWGIEIRTIGELQRYSGVNLAQYSLTNLVEDASLGRLATTLYQGMTIAQVEGLAGYITTRIDLSEQQISTMKVADLVTQYPELATIDFSSMPLDRVPGIMQAPLAAFPLWQTLVVGQVPGLDQVPFSVLFPCAIEQGSDGNRRDPGVSGSVSGF